MTSVKRKLHFYILLQKYSYRIFITPKIKHFLAVVNKTSSLEKIANKQGGCYYYPPGKNLFKSSKTVLVDLHPKVIFLTLNWFLRAGQSPFDGLNMGLNFSLINFSIIKTSFLRLRKMARFLWYNKYTTKTKMKYLRYLNKTQFLYIPQGSYKSFHWIDTTCR